MLKLYIFLFFTFIEFIFLFFFQLSIFFLLFQSIIFNLFFLSFFINIPDIKKNIKKSSLSYYCLEFVSFYIFYETIFFLIFSISYFLNLYTGYIIICFFKQGTFPFLFYNFLFSNLVLKYIVIKDFIFIFLIISKIWVLVLYGKVVFCLSFYSFCFTINLFMIFLNFSKDILIFLGIGFTLSNSVLGVLCQINNVTCMFFYSIVIIIFYKVCFNGLFVNSKFIGKDLKFFYSLLIIISNGIPLTFFISIKFIFILVLGDYSIFSIICYSLISSVLLLYSGIIFFSIFGENFNLIVKLDYFYFIVFILFLIFLSFIF